MLYWFHQILYTGAVIVWMAAVVMLARDFFRGYRGRVYDDAHLSHHAGMSTRQTGDVPLAVEYLDWRAKRAVRTKRWLKLFVLGIALQATLHLLQGVVAPSFEIPFYSPPTQGEVTGDDPPVE